MIINFSGFEFDLGDDEKKLETAFPLTFDGHQLIVKATVEDLEEDEILGHYACGDTLNNAGCLVAATQCSDAPHKKIVLDMIVRTVDDDEDNLEPSPDEIIQVHKSTTVTCEEHAIVSLMQVIFMSGLLASREMPS